MSDAAMRQAYERFLAARQPAGRADCPPPDALLALAERRGTESERLLTLDHAMACAACRKDLDLLRAIVGADRLSAARRWAQPRWLAAAAVLVVALGAGTLWLRRPGGGDASFRAGGDAVTLVAPTDSVAPDAAVVFTWRSVPQAVMYRVELLSAGGDSLLATESRDTVATLPAGRLAAGASYLWSVHAVFADGSHTTSPPSRFRVVQR